MSPGSFCTPQRGEGEERSGSAVKAGCPVRVAEGLSFTAARSNGHRPEHGRASRTRLISTDRSGCAGNSVGRLFVTGHDFGTRWTVMVTRCSCTVVHGLAGGHGPNRSAAFQTLFADISGRFGAVRRIHWRHFFPASMFHELTSMPSTRTVLQQLAEVRRRERDVFISVSVMFLNWIPAPFCHRYGSTGNATTQEMRRAGVWPS